MVCKVETHSDETKAARYTFIALQALHQALSPWEPEEGS